MSVSNFNLWEDDEQPRRADGTAPLSQSQLADGRTAARAADEYRARILSQVSLGELDAAGVVLAASEDSQQARWISRIRLVKLLAAIPRWNKPRARAALNVAFPKVDADQLNIAWLLDGRTKGRRVIGFAGLLTARGDGPWPGFPFTDPPKMGRR